MKKARAEKTVKLHGRIWVRGTIFSTPYPDGVQREIEEETGTVEEFDVPDESEEEPESIQETASETMMSADAGGQLVDGSESEEEKSAIEETDAQKKLRLEKYALEKFGVNIDRRKGLPKIEAQIAELEARAAAGIVNDAG